MIATLPLSEQRLQMYTGGGYKNNFLRHVIFLIVYNTLSIEYHFHILGALNMNMTCKFYHIICKTRLSITAKETNGTLSIIPNQTVPKYIVLLQMIFQRTEVTITKGILSSTWWRHQMETFSALLAICGPRWIPRTKVSDVEIWCFRWFASE